MAANGMTNGTGLVPVETNEEMDRELQICQLKDKVIALVKEEQDLRELKAEVAAEYRAKIKTVRDSMKKATEEIQQLQQAQLEIQGSAILDAAE